MKSVRNSGHRNFVSRHLAGLVGGNEDCLISWFRLFGATEKGEVAV